MVMDRNKRLAELMGWEFGDFVIGKPFVTHSVHYNWKHPNGAFTHDPFFTTDIALCFSEVVPFMREQHLHRFVLALGSGDEWCATFYDMNDSADMGMTCYGDAPAAAIVEAAIKALEANDE